MKKLSDYKDEEALELWADLLDPMVEILNNGKVQAVIKSGKARLLIAKEILKEKPKEAVSILTRIDPTPVDGLNVLIRLVELITDFSNNESMKSFFGFAEQAEMDAESFGSVTETTQDKEN